MIVQRRSTGSGEEYPTTMYRHRDRAQMFATTRTANAFAIVGAKAGAMHRANQRATADQELAWGPVEPAPGMRTDVAPGTYRFAVSEHDQALLAISENDVHGNRLALGNAVEAT